MPMPAKILLTAILGCALPGSALADSPGRETPVEPVAAQRDSEGLPLWRKIAGWTVLGILVVWLGTRGSGRSEKAETDTDDAPGGEDEDS